ncbi:MAG: sensor histidine kinase [Bdellovibrionota bacterium]
MNITEFSRALDNILNNANNAVHESPDPIIEVSILQSGNKVSIEVRDNGKGIDELLLRRLNDKDFGKATKISGHGIGLGEVWRIVQDHGGDLWFEPIPSGGMCVRILISVVY